MKLDLSEIARIPGSYAELEIDVTLKDVEDIPVTAPIRGTMTASGTGRVLLLEGAVDTEVELVCFRCGATYSQPVHATIEEDFVVQPAVPHGQALKIEEDEAPESRLFFPGTLDLNLDELLRQSILVSLPLKPLCADDCQGLCTHCGQRLAEGSCSCASEAVDPRMAELHRLLESRQRK